MKLTFYHAIFLFGILLAVVSLFIFMLYPTHIIYHTGILIGVGFTIFGLWVVEYLKNKYEQQRLIEALQNEVRANANIATVNLVGVNTEEHIFIPFYTIAFEQFKLGMKFDEKYISTKLLLSAYWNAELLNREFYSRIKDADAEYVERFLKDANDFLKKIKEDMLKISEQLAKFVD